MERRTLLRVLSASWLFSFSGCVFARPSDQGLGRSADLVVWNLTEHDQNVTVTIKDDSEKTIHSDRYDLSPKDTENYNVRVPEIVRVSRTYYVEVATDDRRTTHELEVPQAGVIDVTVHGEEIGISYGHAEG